MKNLLAALFFVWMGATHALDIPGLHTLKVGDSAPDFLLPGIDGTDHSLREYKDARVLVIAFISNHCPDSQAAEQRIISFVKSMADRSVALVAINPNSPDGLRPDELGYSKYNDGFDDMKKHAEEQGFNFPYLYDGETQATAKAYGCLATPHVFVFDQERKLQYSGQFDDSRFAPAETVKSPDVERAVKALLAGLPVPKSFTRPHGCSTKWLEKKALVAKDDEFWSQVHVDVEPIDAAGVQSLAQGGKGTYRLFNVWATWCAPCVAEFPELVKTSRKFGLRDFELITISLDAPEKAGAVQSFLEKRGLATPRKVAGFLKRDGRKTNHYIYAGADQAPLVAALDPEWPGPIPHTVLVDPQGKIIWRQNGPVNGEELREVILQAMGRFYVP